MKRIAQIISWIALVGTIVPPCLFFAGQLSLVVMQQWLLGAAVVWFVATPFWMEHKTTD
jgi:hypothetical protein